MENNKLNGYRKVRHHLLEIILWPKDGKLIPIINSREDLKRLGIYDDYKMTIELNNSEHSSMHNHYLNKDRKQKLIESLRKRVVSEATRNSMSSKRKLFWATHPEVKAKMIEKVRLTKSARSANLGSSQESELDQHR